MEMANLTIDCGLNKASGKSLIPREWLYAKILHCVKAGKSKAPGVVLVGVPGSGKTTVLSNIVHPTESSSRQIELNRRLLASYYCDPQCIQSLKTSNFILDLINQLRASPLLKGYEEKLQHPDLSLVLQPSNIERSPDEAFKKAVLAPLLEVQAPNINYILVVDGIDETKPDPERRGPSNHWIHTSARLSSTLERMTVSGSLSYSESPSGSSICDLLSVHHHFLPPWLILVCSARQHTEVSTMFTGFRKIFLDDPRKLDVVRDMQQYILNRIDVDPALRRHLSRENLEMLNQLHIKCNGCLLYLEQVLDGVVDNSIILREIRDIPGTLNGLYLWYCQRLFGSNIEFDSQIRPLLCVLLTAAKPVSFEDIYLCLWSWDSDLTREVVRNSLHRLSKIITTSRDEQELMRIFHESFSEWLCDVKHCTQRFLCKPQIGHTIWALRYSSLCKATDLTVEEASDLQYHLRRSGLPYHLQLLWQSHCTGEPLVEDNFFFRSVSSLTNGGCDSVAEALSINNSQTSTTTNALLKDSVFLENKVTRLLLEGCSAPNLKRFEDAEILQDIQVDGRSSSTADGAMATAMTALNVTFSEKEETCKDIEQIVSHNNEIVSRAVVIDDGFIAEVDNAEPSSHRTLLHRAAEAGDLEFVDQLIAIGAAVESADRNGQTPLNLAARQGHLDVVTTLIRVGAAVDRADVDGWTPLRSSAWAGHSDVVEVLLQNNASVDLADADGRTALRAAAWGGHDKIVRTLVAAGADVNARDAEGRTALIAAAYMGHAAIVGQLLDAGADINHADKDGRTALSVAALCVPASQGHHAAVVSLLLERGAEVDHRDSEAMTALLVAAFEGHADVCELLLEGGADVDHADATGRTPLFAAASMGHANVVNRLLFWGAYIDSIDSEGRTVLSVAAAQGNPQTVESLLCRGLDELHRDNAGWTALHYAAFEGHAEVCQLLMNAGAKPSEVDTDGRTPLILSAQEGHPECVRLFVEQYPHILEHRSHDGRTALRMAAMQNHAETVDLLLFYGANVNYQDVDGRSTLYLLALEGNVAMIKHLIDAGADCEAVDLEGRTALHVAAWQGHLGVVELLLSQGASVDALDRESRSALQSAAWQGHADVVRLLVERGGARVNHVCSQGASALGIAAQEGHVAVVRELLAHGADIHHMDLCDRTPARVAFKAGHPEVAALIEAHGRGSQGAQSTAGSASSASGSAGGGVDSASKGNPISGGSRHLQRRRQVESDRGHATVTSAPAVPPGRTNVVTEPIFAATDAADLNPLGLSPSPRKAVVRAKTLLEPATRESFAESVVADGSESGIIEPNLSFTAMLQRKVAQARNSSYNGPANCAPELTSKCGTTIAPPLNVGGFHNLRRTKIVTNPNFIGISSNSGSTNNAGAVPHAFKNKETPI